MPHDHMIADGRPHRMPCPAPGHPGDRSAKSVAYRWDGHNLPMLKCWSGECPYGDIAKGLGLSFDRPRRNDLSRFIVGRYEHEDPGEPARLAYRRDFPIDFEGYSTCPYRVDGETCGKTFRHKHVWSSRGRRQGTKVLLWGEDKPGNIMVVVEGEKAAASLTEMVNEDGTPFEGYTPVTFYGGGSSAALANWDAIEGREVLIWPDNDEAGHKAADNVFDTIAGNVRSARKVEIEVLERELPDKADAFDLATDAERIACLHEVRGVYKTSTRVVPNITRAQRLEHGVPIPEGKSLLPSLTDKELHVALWWLWLYGEGRIVGQEHVSGDKDLAHIYDVSDTGLLVPRVDELTNDLIGVGAVYRERIATSSDSAIQGAFRSMLGFARDLADLSKPLLIKRGLVPESFIELRKQGIEPKARVVDYREIDVERRYLGAPNGIIDLETGKLLTGRAHAGKLVSHTIQDYYDPKAGDERVEKLAAHLRADDERWLWSSLGASLWGSGVSAEGGLYILRGPSQGGKTTLLESVVAALGRPYGTMVPGGFIERDEAGRSRRGGANPDPFELDGPRFACLSEWTKGMSLAGVAKNVASGDVYQGSCKLYEGYTDYPSALYGERMDCLQSRRHAVYRLGR